MIYALITLMSIAAFAAFVCFAAWTAGALLFVLALCKSAKLGDEAAKANPFLKGEQTGSISETRGGNDAAPQLLSMNPDLLRGFKTSLAVLLVACAVGCESRDLSHERTMRRLDNANARSMAKNAYYVGSINSLKLANGDITRDEFDRAQAECFLSIDQQTETK